MSLQRQIDKHYAIGVNNGKRFKTLDKHNDKQEERYLHATKGIRKVSAKRSRAAMLTAEIKRGMQSFNTLVMKAVVKGI